MLEFNQRSNTLEQREYKYMLQDVEKPNLYRHLYNYDEVPKIPFNHRHVPMRPPKEIWITDTTFRDGQQAREPYTVEQIVHLYKLLHRLGGPKGIIRQSEFFLYSKKDREAVERCMELGYEYPQITSWIRAVKEDFQLVKAMGIKETGILASASDYHIFNKLKLTRKQAMEKYLAIVKDALELGITPRVHLEDITRADFYGFVVPFAIELNKLSKKVVSPSRSGPVTRWALGSVIPASPYPEAYRGSFTVYGTMPVFPANNWNGTAITIFTGRWSTREPPGFTVVPG